MLLRFVEGDLRSTCSSLNEAGFGQKIVQGVATGVAQRAQAYDTTVALQKYVGQIEGALQKIKLDPVYSKDELLIKPLQDSIVFGIRVSTKGEGDKEDPAAPKIAYRDYTGVNYSEKEHIVADYNPDTFTDEEVVKLVASYLPKVPAQAVESLTEDILTEGPIKNFFNKMIGKAASKLAGNVQKGIPTGKLIADSLPILEDAARTLNNDFSKSLAKVKVTTEKNANGAFLIIKADYLFQIASRGNNFVIFDVWGNKVTCKSLESMQKTLEKLLGLEKISVENPTSSAASPPSTAQPDSPTSEKTKQLTSFRKTLNANPNFQKYKDLFLTQSSKNPDKLVTTPEAREFLYTLVKNLNDTK